MSEGPDISEAPVGEDAFEAARLAEQDEGDSGLIEGKEEGAEGEGEEGEKPAVDWQKRAHDKEGLAAKERARRRAAETRARELEQRLERLESAVKPAKASDDTLENLIAAMPDAEEDPVGATAHIAKIMKMFGEQQAAETETETRQQTAKRELERLAATVQESEAEFADEHPDYADAVNHLAKAILADLEDEGYAGEALERAFQQRRLDLAKRFVANGRDPAEGTYNLAKKRGFASGEQQKTDKLKEIAAAAGASRVPAGGKNGETRLTAEAVNKLKGAAYDSAWAKLREQERRAG